MTRAGVAWFSVGCQMGAYEHALRYATGRLQFGKPIAGFQLVQDLLVRMLGNVAQSQTMCLRMSLAATASCSRTMSGDSSPMLKPSIPMKARAR